MTLSEERAKRLRQLKDGARKIGGTSVSVVDAETRELFDGEGEPFVRVVLTLSDPPAGADTWPVDEVQEIWSEVQDLAYTLVEGRRVEVTVRSQSGDTDEPEQTAEDVRRALNGEREADSR